MNMASPDVDLHIWVVPFHGQGHLFPCIQLCHHFAARNSAVTLVVSADLASSVPSSLRHHPGFRVAELSSSPPPRRHGPDEFRSDEALEGLLSSSSAAPHCAVVDVMMSRMIPVFRKFGVTTVSFFTSGACSAAMEYSLWKASPVDLKPGQTRMLPGLPEEMSLSHADLKRRPHGPPGGPPPGFRHSSPPPPGGPFEHRKGQSELGGPLDGPPPGFHHSSPQPGAPWGHRKGPPELGGPPPWIEEVKDSEALLFNTSDDLERPFLEYIAGPIGKPVCGVGPLLPEQFWKSSNSLLHDCDHRSNRPSNVTEDEVIAFLDSKPRGSVMYVAFGSEVGPTVDEYPELAAALESSTQPFIWVIPSGRSPHENPENHLDPGFEKRIGNRGLLIKGWAPQLLILSHPSTAAFLSHCGWNSTTEAIGRGIPILAWPIRGDQYWNAKLVSSHLKIGSAVTDDLSQKVIEKDAILKGIERVMGDEEMKERAWRIGAKFRHGFPECSIASIDSFYRLIHARRPEQQATAQQQLH